MNHEICYGDVQDILPEGADCETAAQVHGLLAGLLCADPGTSCGIWLERALGAADKPGPDGYALLAQLHEETRRQLDDFDFSFAPLLPDDEYDLEARADALGEWCQGFLLGVGYGSKGQDWPDECAEVLQDFVDITQLDPEVSGEEDEVAYAELAEYVRAGVQVIRAHSLAPAPGHRLH